tara:strand:+ start:887 stop:2344 length:1458 start_codon:yes stop_codon:yes gene_type:complete
MYFKFLKNIYSYSRLCWNVNNYYNDYIRSNEHNLELLKNITDLIIDCGSVTIKFCQWITPKLELIYLDETSDSKEKPLWLKQLEKFYEDCPNHEDTITKEIYNQEFNDNFDDLYTIKRIIGSGSIGQVYLVYNKEKKREEVIKVLHPNIEDQISFFKRILSFFYSLPIISSRLKKFFPVDTSQFINDFEEQIDLINEANHLLYFYQAYKDNQFIIIPELFQISSKMLIMSYEPGVSFDKSEINDYEKDKIVNLFHLFIRTNQMIKNYNHGDLHPGNWKIKEDSNNINKLIIYDFGYCWKISRTKYKELGNIFIDTFEEASKDNPQDSIDNLCKCMYFIVLYEGEDKETDYQTRIRKFLIDNLNNIEPWKVSVSRLLKITIQFCIMESTTLDPILIQSFIIALQVQKLFERYDLQSSNNNIISDYKVFRERYLTILAYCKTHNIFPEYSELIENKLNQKQLKVESIFDTIQLDEKIQKLALKLKKI